MHHLMKESTPVQSPPRSGFHRTSSPNALGLGATQQMSSSLQDPTPSRAGCRAEMELGANLDFPWACLAPTSLTRGLKASAIKQSLVGAAYSLRQCSSHFFVPFRTPPSPESQAAPRKARTSHMQGNLHVWFWPGTPVYCTNMCRSP